QIPVLGFLLTPVLESQKPFGRIVGLSPIFEAWELLDGESLDLRFPQVYAIYYLALSRQEC
ncbi:MAG: hypothetical protein NZ653_02345, partial [Anaerolineae bacterium]|nr:hypothetical protein [Anaerolineae bacterium]